MWMNHDTVTVDGCEILYQLIDGKHHIIHRVLTILLVVQDFFHYLPSTVVLVKSSLVSLFQCTSHILEWLGYLHSNFKRSLIVLRLGVSWISGCHWVMASNHLKLKVIL